MKSRWSVVALSSVACLLVLAGSAFAPSSPSSFNSRYRRFTPRTVAGQLPHGFVLPQSDADLGVSALAFEDLDDDGDIDIVAAEPDADFNIGTADGSTAPVGIIVWVNDGSGRLTRKTPAPSNSLGSGPASPSLDEHEGPVTAPIQPDAPAGEAVSANTWLTGSGRPSSLALVVVIPSVTPHTLRSRSPPVLS
jgi:hypothetical protein